MEEHNSYSDVTPEIVRLAELSREAGVIDSELFTKYDVKRGLRDLNGKGVLAGLTNISDVRATKMVDGKSVPCDGHLFYRGYEVNDLVEGFHKDHRFGFEEVTYLLLFNKLPDKQELAGEFEKLLILQKPSHKLRERYYHEGAQQRYDEYPGKEYSHSLLLRRQSG